MIVVLPFHSGEVAQVRELLSWCGELGGCPRHRAILLADAAISWVEGMELLEQAQGVFGDAGMVSTDEPITGGWPSAANRMFLFAAAHMEREEKAPWLWLEADAIPLHAGWLDELDAAYAACGKPLMGAVVSAMLNNLPFSYLNGVAVYPANAHSVMSGRCGGAPRAFDVACADLLLPLAANTPLVHCHWGLPGKPPIFALQRDPGTPNIVTLDFIRKGAALFHRNKDGSLITQLRRQLSGHTGAPLTVVLPFCNKDGEWQLRNLRWMAEMHGRTRFPAMVTYPRDTSGSYGRDILRAAEAVFSPVRKVLYHGTSTRGWPEGANQAFQVAAASMVGVGPWLWLESDATPTRPDWLDTLALEYARRGKPFFGPIVPARGHMNGVAIYPADFPTRCPRTMSCADTAFDWVMKDEMIHECYDASALIQHCWGIVGGRPHAWDGEPAHFASQAELANWLDPGAVLFHRCKNGSLIDRLRERRGGVVPPQHHPILSH